MNIRFGALLGVLLMFGCQPAETPKAESLAATPPVSTPSGSGGIAPIGSGIAGGISPVSGGESVDGAGMGGTGQAAKDMARRAAATPQTQDPGAAEGAE